MNDQVGPTIGVIIPVFNCEHYVEEAIESVLNQSCAPSHIVICDDASTDKTSHIIRRYELKYPKLIQGVYHQMNIGIAGNRNSGLRRIDEDYVSMLDGDDFWHTEKLAREVEALSNAAEARWAYSLAASVDREGTRMGSLKRQFDGESGWIVFQTLAHQIVLRDWLAETALVRETGLFDTRLTVYEDWDYKIRLAAKAPIACIEQETVFHRQNTSGLSSSEPSILRSCLELVYKKHVSLIESIKPKHRRYIKRRKYADLTRLDIRIALEEKGNKNEAFKKAMSLLRINYRSVTDWVFVIKRLLPKPFYSLIMIIMKHLRHHRA